MPRVQFPSSAPLIYDFFKILSAIVAFLISFCLWFTVWGIGKMDFFFIIGYWWVIATLVVLLIVYTVVFVIKFERLKHNDKVIFLLVWLLPLLEFLALKGGFPG